MRIVLDEKDFRALLAGLEIEKIDERHRVKSEKAQIILADIGFDKMRDILAESQYGKWDLI